MEIMETDRNTRPRDPHLHNHSSVEMRMGDLYLYRSSYRSLYSGANLCVYWAEKQLRTYVV